MPLLLCRLCGELVSSSADRCRCGGSTRQTSTLASSPSATGEGPVDRWQKKYASNLPPPVIPSTSSNLQPVEKTSMHPPPSPSLSKTYGSLLSTSSPLACVSCSRPFPPDATLFPVKPNPNHDFFTHPEEEEKFKCRNCYSKEDSLGDCEKCGRAVLGVKELGSNGRGEGMFVRSVKRIWCQGCFICGGCSTPLRPSASNPPLLHPITAKPTCEDCLFNPNPSSSSASQATIISKPSRPSGLTTSNSNLGGFGPSSARSRDETTPSNAAVEELRARLGIATISPSLSSSSSSRPPQTNGRVSTPSSPEPSTRPAPSSYSSTRRTQPSSTSYTSPHLPKLPAGPSQPSSASPNLRCPGCSLLLTEPPSTSSPPPPRPYGQPAPPPGTTSIALITLPSQLGGETYHSVCFKCDSCGDALVKESEGKEDGQVGVGVNEKGKGVCMKCANPSRLVVSHRQNEAPPVPASTSSPRTSFIPRSYASSSSPSTSRPLQTATGNGRVSSPQGGAVGRGEVGGVGAERKKVGSGSGLSILERAGVKRRVN